VTADPGTHIALRAAAYRIPTDAPEADGTIAWDATTAVVVEANADGLTGLGWTYGPVATQQVVTEILAPALDSASPSDPEDLPGQWLAMARALRNAGRPGIGSLALSAVDCALWNLKAARHSVPLSALLGRVREAVPVYGSGGFTTYDEAQLRGQVAGWVGDLGVSMIKIKVAEAWGTRPERDLARAAIAQAEAGDRVELFVDANGGYTRGQAIRLGRRYDDVGVTWFEEPVSSDDLIGLAHVRAAVCADVTAGEYAYDLAYVQRMCAAEAVDCVQLDVTRCGGISEFLRAAAVAASQGLEVSAHCAPAAHVALGLAVPNLRHLEYFHDHARVESVLFENVPEVRDGSLRPADGVGVQLRSDADRWRIG
jgi:L-alanine-DL-glutamate epimerase-like enolase superfamily enzyme